MDNKNLNTKKYVFFFPRHGSSWNEMEPVASLLLSSKKLEPVIVISGSQTRFIAEIARNIGDLVGSTWYIAPFLRYENLDFHEKTDSSATSNRDYQDNQYWNYGLTIKPIANIVIKADVLRHTSPGANDNTRQFNLGIGYIF